VEFRLCLERVEDCLQSTRDKKRTLEVNLGDAVAQMVEDHLWVQALQQL
jgi:hypothetical protein